MDSLVEYKIDKNFDKNQYQYFFTLLNNRFELVNEHLTNLLENRFNKKFKPIYILPAKPNKFFKKGNYIVLNEEMKKLKRKTGIKKLIYLQEYEDLNIEFSNSVLVKRITNKLAKKQDKIFLISFTSFGLNELNPKIINIGPKTSLVNKYENKIEQVKLFKRLKLPVNKTKIYKNIDFLLKNKNKKFPLYVSTSYTSGGHESVIAFSNKDILNLKAHIRPCNKKEKVFVARFIKNVKLSPNLTAIVVKRNKTIPIMITDQILRGNVYLGSIFPSKTTKKHKKAMLKTSIRLGNYLSKKGFRGIFGCDFIIDKKDNLFIVDLNPRRQGGYLCLLLMSKKVNILDIELSLALNEKVPKFFYKDIQCNFVWACHKINPPQEYVKLLKEFKCGKEKDVFEKLGKDFKCMYFPKNYFFNGGVAGYYITSGISYKKVLEKVKINTNKILIDSCKDI